MIRVGIAGIGFMGMVHYLSYQKIRGVKVAALCEQDQSRLDGDWRPIKGNFGPPGKRMDLKGIATYTNLDDLLADESLDLIDITLPPSLHTPTTIAALKSGKHVFCEKPMALTTRECDAMARAAKKAKKRLLIGHVLPFAPEYAWALKMIRSGRFGKLLGGTFKRVISDPAWLTHFWSAEKTGGPMLDLHVHDAHFIRLLFGMPKAVTSKGRLKKGLAEYWNTTFDYGPKGPTVLATSGTISQQGRSFTHGYEIHLEKATLTFEFAVFGTEGKYLREPTILESNGKVKTPKLGSGDPMESFQSEMKEVATCVKKNVESAILNAQLARDAIQICQKQTESLRSGRAVRL